MNGGDNYGDYTGHGIDETDDPREIKIGDNVTHKMRSAEDNPEKPLDKGEASGKEGGILNAGEKNQQSDKDSSESSGSWTNNTGKAKTPLDDNPLTKRMNKLKPGKKMKGIKTGLLVVGPAGTVLILLAVFIGVVLGSSSSLLGAAIGNIQGSLDTLDIAAATRSRVIVTSILLGSNTRGGVWGNFSSHMKKMFSKADVDVVTDSDGVDHLEFKNVKGDTELVDGGNFEKLYDEDIIFHDKAFEGMKTYNSSAGAYHDSTSKVVFDGLGVNRNSNGDIKKGKNQEETKANFDKDAKAEFEQSTRDGLSGGMESGKKTQKEETDTHGNVNKVDTVDTGRGSMDIKPDVDVEARLGDIVSDKVGNGVDFSIVSQAANGICLLYTTTVTINNMLKAYEKYQVIKMGMKVFEAIQRAQAGHGGADTIVDVVTNYATRTQTTELELEKDEKTTITTSAIGSTPMAAFFGGPKLTSEDPAVRAFIASPSEFRKIIDSIDTRVGYKSCATVRVAAGLIDAGIDTLTLGTKKLIDIVVGVVLGASIGIVAGSLISIMAPKIVRAFGRNFDDLLEGVQGGAALAWTGDSVIKEEEKYTAMNVATEQTAGIYLQKRNEIIADRARYDRNTLSPFDTSSPYTFMGTLLQNYRKAIVTNSAISSVGRIASIVSSSLISLTPASHAADAIDNIVTEGKYPEINDLVNDGETRLATAFGTPYYVPDFTTMNKTPEDVMWYWDAKGAFSEPYDPVSNPNPTIAMDNDNELALCIEEKINRGADLGTVDAEIEAKYSPLDTGSSAIDSTLGAVPIIGGLIDAANNVDHLKHLENILGSKYHADTKENHMCERYALDQRMGEAMGVYDKAQTTTYIEKYREKHPLDNSTLGVIARFSGLTKEQVKTTIAQINALLFIADYHPDGFGPLFFKEPTVELSIKSTKNNDYIIGIVYRTSFIEIKRDQNTTA